MRPSGPNPRRGGERRVTRASAWRPLLCALGWGAGLVSVAGCPPSREPRRLEMEPIGTVKGVATTPLDEDGEGDVTTPNSGTPAPGTTPCSAPDFDDLEEALKRCEVPMPRASEVPAIKDKLEVSVTASSPTITPGGRLDVQITLRNTSGDPLALYFTGDPSPRFDVEAVDTKGRRVDVPPGKWPGYPKGFRPEAREAKAAKVTLDKNGSARIKVPWDAVKMKWAPEKAKVWQGRGYPRVPSGPLARGKYSLRVVLPLIGDIATPKLDVTVGS